MRWRYVSQINGLRQRCRGFRAEGQAAFRIAGGGDHES